MNQPHLPDQQKTIKTTKNTTRPVVKYLLKSTFGILTEGKVKVTLLPVFLMVGLDDTTFSWLFCLFGIIINFSSFKIF